MRYRRFKYVGGYMIHGPSSVCSTITKMDIKGCWIVQWKEKGCIRNTHK